MNSAPPQVSVINLGCARNLVDAQMILGRLKAKGFSVVDAGQARVLIINTCCFIDAARQETIDTILDVLQWKKEGRVDKVILAGCLVQRYGQDLLDELKDIDALVGVPVFAKDRCLDQVALTPGHYAYLKICEGCYNLCSYCVIPRLKGPLASRNIRSLVREMRLLNARGVREVNLIGQDVSAYGIDIDGRSALVNLLRQLTAAAGDIDWIRLLYLFPARVTDELLDYVAGEEKICNYIDLPLQHINARILKAMNRPMAPERIKKLIDRIRQKIPGVCLRSSFIVGFPGETEREFEELMDFIRDVGFDRLGAFPYSREEGTRAYALKPQVPAKVRQERYDILMREQQEISRRRLQGRIGGRVKVLIDEKVPEQENIFLGRTEGDAPEVDGRVVVTSDRPLKPGVFVEVYINDSTEYDLYGTAV